MKYLKKTTALLLSVLLLFSAMVTGVTVTAEGNTATITVTSVEDVAGANVDVPVKITTTGVLGLDFEVNSELEVNSYTIGENFEEVYPDEDFYNNSKQFVLLAKGTEDVAGEDVVVLTLNVAIPADAEEAATYNITLSNAVVTNYAEEDIVTATNDGSVTVAAAEVEGPAVVTNMMNGSTSYAEFEYESLEAALAEAYVLASEQKHGNKWCDAFVTVNDDVVLTDDIEIPSFTTLTLGDNVVTKGDYEFNITGNGAVVANYEIDFWDDNTFVIEDENNGVYTYTVSVELELYSKYLTPTDQIYINFDANKTVNYDGDLEFGFDYYFVSNPDAVITINSEDFISNTSKEMKLVTNGIPAKDLSNQIVGRYWAKTVIDGTEHYAYSNTLFYSVAIYAQNKLGTSEKLDNLLKSMLNYGAAFQVIKGHNLDNLANSILDEADKVLPSQAELQASEAWVAPTEVDHLKAYSKAAYYVDTFQLELLDVINIKYNCVNDGAGNVTPIMCVWTQAEYDALTANCTTPAEISAALTQENCNNIVNLSENGDYFLVEGIAAKKYADTIVTRSMYVDANGNTQLDWLWSYSPVKYCINKINDSATSEYDINYSNLGKALMIYAYSARQYFEYTVNAG